jgi:hypothetical protein
MTVNIEPRSKTEAAVTVEGLEPGETIKLLYERAGEVTEATSTLTIEVGPTEPIGPEGRFKAIQRGLEPREDGVNQWDIKIIHARGVACTRVELP